MLTVLTSWSWEPAVLIGLAMAAALYFAGWQRLRHRGRGRAAPSRWQVSCYAGGLVVIGIALLSPIGTFDEALFFLHMTQHLLLLIVAPVLLWLGALLLPALWGLPPGLRRDTGQILAPRTRTHRVFRTLTTGLVSALIYLMVIAIRHLPRYYDAAQGETFVHYLEHAMFLGSGLLYWWPVIHPGGGRRRLEYTVPYIGVAVTEGGCSAGY